MGCKRVGSFLGGDYALHSCRVRCRRLHREINIACILCYYPLQWHNLFCFQLFSAAGNTGVNVELVINCVDILLHLDTYLHEVIQQYGGWTYLIFFIIIFCETGLVVTPFLPGDSLLFIAGTFCALGSLHLGWLLIILCAAAILGNTVNYSIGNYIGPRVFYMEDSRFFKKAYLERTHAFFEKYGPITIVIGRFLPIIRTFAPFLAGVGRMSYGRFLTYNIIGCVLWIFLFTLGGYFFGTIPVVKNNFTLVIIIILVVSLLPTLIELLRQRGRSRRAQIEGAAEIDGPTRQQ